MLYFSSQSNFFESRINIKFNPSFIYHNETELALLTKEELLVYTINLQARLSYFVAKKFAKSSEKFQDPSYIQLSLFNEAEIEAINPEQVGEFDSSKNEDEDEKKPKPSKKRGKRKPLPLNLLRKKFLKKLTEEEKKCHLHGTERIVIGEKVLTEKLEHIPAQLYVRVDTVETCKCEACERDGLEGALVQAKAEESIIPKSFATPSLITEIIVNKYIDSMPLYRQEAMFSRLDIDLNRSTMARWIIAISEKCQPVINLMKEAALESTVLNVDETYTQVLKEKDRKAEQKSYMWVMKTAVGDPIVIFQYHPNRSKNAASELLDDYKGVVVADGYSAYTSLLKTAAFTLAGCMAHVRRKFFEAEKYAKASKIKEELIQSTQFLGCIRLLYKIESKLKEKNADYDAILQTRTAESVPILQTMELKLKELEHSVLPKSPLGKAINYALNQWSKLTLFTTNGQIPIDNNAAENAIRPFVVGRKNWLFADTPKGADASANIYSLIESAKACGIEPSKYLKHLLENISAAKNVEDFEVLMPHKCRDALSLNNKA